MRSARQPNKVRAAAVSLNEHRSRARTPQQALPYNLEHLEPQKIRGPNVRECVLLNTHGVPPRGGGGAAHRWAWARAMASAGGPLSFVGGWHRPARGWVASVLEDQPGQNRPRSSSLARGTTRARANRPRGIRGKVDRARVPPERPPRCPRIDATVPAWVKGAGDSFTL